MTLRSLLPLATLVVLPAASFAQFADGTLAVVTIGDGVNFLSEGGNRVTLRNYARTGSGQTPLASTTLPLYLGTNNYEGQLQSDGGDPRNLYLGGFSGTAPSGPVFATTGARVPRRVTGFDTRTGAAASTDLGPNDYSGVSLCSAQVIGTSILAAGDGPSSPARGGILTGTFTGTSTTLAQGASNGSTRLAKNLGGTLYYTDGENIYTGPNGTNPIFRGGAPGNLIAGFVLVGRDTVYYTNPSTFGTPTPAGLFRSTRGADGLFGTPTRLYSGAPLLALATDGTRLFATTDGGYDNALLSFDLNGGDVRTLATAGTNRAFRGVEVVPEPASLAALALGALALLKRRRK